jgi:UDP-N-acetylmuramoylalanine--D-glutamate ligase
MSGSQTAAPQRFGSALVLGLGASGVAAARRLLAEGTEVHCLDSADTETVRRAAGELSNAGASVVLGCGEPPAGGFDVAVLSPGIACDSEWVRSLEGRGVAVVSELELGGSRVRCPMLAVTGTNGKSTVVKLCRDAMREAGMKAEACGNYGPPLCALAGRSDALDWLVVEVSSFQLERVSSFSPQVGVLLNVQPDHLDRHGNIDRYRRTKARLFDRMTAAQSGVIEATLLSDVSRETCGQPLWTTFGPAGTADWTYGAGNICRERNDRSEVVCVEGTAFDNAVLGLGAAAVVAALDACGVPARAAETAIRGFEPLPHRLQHVATIKGVRFIDDSKATNLAALAAALRTMQGPVRLIAGGLLKEKDLTWVKEVLAKTDAAVYLIGAGSLLMEEAWGDCVACRRCGTLEKAVADAWGDATEGDTVLLAPGCASFDQFKNYRDRGECFDQLVRLLAKEI